MGSRDNGRLVDLVDELAERVQQLEAQRADDERQRTQDLGLVFNRLGAIEDTLDAAMEHPDSLVLGQALTEVRQLRARMAHDYGHLAGTLRKVLGLWSGSSDLIASISRQLDIELDVD